MLMLATYWPPCPEIQTFVLDYCVCYKSVYVYCMF